MKDSTTKEKGMPRFGLKVFGSIVLMCVLGCGLVWLSTYWLDLWTHHGDSITVPNVKGMHFDKACELLEADDFEVVLQDSVYEDGVAPGTVVEQNPKDSTQVKPGRTIYLTINAFYPRTVLLPSLTDVSMRQAITMLEGIGIEDVKVKEVPSEYGGLVLAVYWNGRRMTAGTRVPLTAKIVLEVGKDLDYDSMPVDTLLGKGSDEPVKVNDLPADLPKDTPAPPKSDGVPAAAPASNADKEDDWGAFD
ncbi:MAG: PASTA domain-containing protein [Bacteroides sp.]|nr:PASTA domain-containing protein [Bacteroides sp.]MCM1413143.1 PASTA domain-containing protein [Bacteroides sp.]MCM1472115.1 PASTA domain-containing protein [Bacteroides sp.]